MPTMNERPQVMNSNRTACKGCNAWKNVGLNANGYCPRCWEEIKADLSTVGEKAEGHETHIDRNCSYGVRNAGGPSAPSVLLKAREHMEERAGTYDTQGGERSMAKAVAIFNAGTGLTMSEEEGWLFMVCLKMARSTQPGYNPDDYEDMSAYSALLGECAGRA